MMLSDHHGVKGLYPNFGCFCFLRPEPKILQQMLESKLDKSK